MLSGSKTGPCGVYRRTETLPNRIGGHPHEHRDGAVDGDSDFRDGFCAERVVRLSKPLSHRFPLIVESMARLRSRSCIIDGEAVACDDNGVASFDLVRHHRANESVFLYAFDLIELNGDDLRHDPLEGRKATLASIVAKAAPGIRFNKQMEGDSGPSPV